MMMKKAPLYSRSKPALQPALQPGLSHALQPGPVAAAASPPSPRPSSTALRRHERWAWAGALVLLGLLGLGAFGTFDALDWNVALNHPGAPLTLAQIDKAMRESIRARPLASAAAHAYAAILPSVVGVVGLMTEGDDGSDVKADGAKANGATRSAPFERGVGSGVVIVDNGTILTNLHVVHGARRIKVTFMDGTVSDAVLLTSQPENDLAVLRAKTIPDDLVPATLRSTTDLVPGDEVLAVGFPFGIGPSASSGIVSGLKREFRSPEGAQTLTNLIQFDAAANPGSSGGPLVTMEGEVVGIVTAILNPSQQRVFIGIGFAVPIENASSAVGLAPF